MKTANTETLAPPTAEKPAKAKIAYIDHLKILATVLVVLHHTFITYGAPGGWYFKQPSNLKAALFPIRMAMTIFKRMASTAVTMGCSWPRHATGTT